MPTQAPPKSVLIAVALSALAWYKHVHRTMQSFLVTGHRLQDTEASSGIPQHMYMVLPGSQRQEVLFRVVRTICTDRNCAEDLNLQSVVMRLA